MEKLQNDVITEFSTLAIDAKSSSKSVKTKDLIFSKDRLKGKENNYLLANSANIKDSVIKSNKLNFERLKRIEDKSNLVLLFSVLDKC